ncbi:16S rRNA (guanine(527)-N(7))-methyltransferase RsmG [Sphingomonas sp. Leaf357]|uniref:16S rRNA (guanine(527)-N(7))-methyltransferase RsmG n=1 Tax=Sphingomonas sp. Leaf357 TaxID=1736350 RepID=UPI0006F478BF|nr:16S rRNA (guanine(527)-N(7))-methyltransferase RsmG [Sphingomonas sp. Leaf357]KQS03203.1 16S rRNA (guanine(527)-N(7))-methyltransferase RsmG [Sphingomonas sp. Leaf357]
MTEDEARNWIIEHFGDIALRRLVDFAHMVEMESTRQNLVSASTLPMIWSRHILDSAQLVPLAAKAEGPWIDVGTGAGFPGIIAGLLSGLPTVLVEPRRRRVEFLQDAIERLNMAETISVIGSRIETAKLKAGVISARAVAPVAALLESAVHTARKDTLWLLPKGRSAREEVAQAKLSWHGTFHVEQSITDPTSLIVTASGIARR